MEMFSTTVPVKRKVGKNSPVPFFSSSIEYHNILIFLDPFGIKNSPGPFHRFSPALHGLKKISKSGIDALKYLSISFKIKHMKNCDRMNLPNEDQRCKSGEDIHTDDEFYFQWHITESCNQRCAHCYHEKYDNDKELDKKHLLEVAGKMLAAVEKWGRYATFSFTGGEPFLRKEELFELAAYLDGQERAAYYDILTNGSLFEDSLISAVSRLKKLRRVQLSLEGSTPEINDRIRGKGSFHKTISAIKRLKEAGLTVSIMTTVSRINAEDILPLIELLEREGVDTFALERFIPEGQGKHMADEVLSPGEIRRIFESVYEVGKVPRPMRILMYRPLFGLIDCNDPTVGAMCSVGNNALTIMSDGTVLPCRRLPIALGNILVDNLFKIWYDSFLLWEIRNPRNLKGKCRDCELIPICRGCRAAAFARTEDYLAEDPQCWK
jgi:radical SAM protein with 4Fe4S-binding SPASM domain